MRLELNDENKVVEAGASIHEAGEAGSDKKTEQELSPKEEARKIKAERRAKFSSLSFSGKLQYIWDYYRWPIILSILSVIIVISVASSIKDNKRPVYLQAEFLNSNFAFDDTNTIEEDYVSQYDIDLDTYKLYIDTGMNLSTESFDMAILANQQKLVSMYQAGQLDVIIGPLEVMEGPANCNGYADLSKIIPEELLEELKEREYEFYYFDGKELALANGDYDPDYDDDYMPSYFAGIYLDNCSYLNNSGQYGAYPMATTEGERVIFTIAANSENVDHAVEFLNFLVHNH